MQDWPIGRSAIRVQHQSSSMTDVIRADCHGLVSSFKLIVDRLGGESGAFHDDEHDRRKSTSAWKLPGTPATGLA